MKRVGVLLLAILLMASLAMNVALYPKATRPVVGEADQPLIERTIAMHSIGANGVEHGQYLRHHFFPIVVHLADRDCVELRSRHGRGHAGACYDRRTGEVLEETASVSDGPASLREHFEEWTTGLIGWP